MGTGSFMTTTTSRVELGDNENLLFVGLRVSHDYFGETPLSLKL